MLPVPGSCIRADLTCYSHFARATRRRTIHTRKGDFTGSTAFLEGEFSTRDWIVSELRVIRKFTIVDEAQPQGEMIAILKRAEHRLEKIKALPLVDEIRELIERVKNTEMTSARHT